MAQFHCDVCNVDFEQRSRYERHMASSHPERATSAVDFVSALKGIEFPRTRDQIVAYAEQHLDLDDERLVLFRAMPERQYRDAADVAIGLSEIKRKKPHAPRAPSAADIESALAGIAFPASRDELVAYAAERLDPGDERLKLLRALPMTEFRSAADVAVAFGELTRGDARA